jgi:hypothetical protein
VKLGLFKTYTPAARRLRKLNRKRKLRFIGRVLVGYEGNPSIIYCNQRVKEDTLETHEVPLSLMLSGYYPDAHVLRLYEVDKKLRPDATMHLGEATYHWEYDTGSEHKSQVKGQLNAYKDCPDTILFVCKRRKRIDTIKTIAEPVKDTIYFSTFEDVVRDPYGPIWMDMEGQMNSIEKPAEDPGSDSPNTGG